MTVARLLITLALLPASCAGPEPRTHPATQDAGLELTDEECALHAGTDCEASGCTIIPAFDITSSDGTSCDGKPIELCVSLDHGWTDDSPGVFWREAEGAIEARHYPGTPSFPLPDWQRCRGSAGEPTQCGCAAVLGALQ